MQGVNGDQSCNKMDQILSCFSPNANNHHKTLPPVPYQNMVICLFILLQGHWGGIHQQTHSLNEQQSGLGGQANSSAKVTWMKKWITILAYQASYPHQGASQMVHIWNSVHLPSCYRETLNPSWTHHHCLPYQHRLWHPGMLTSASAVLVPHTEQGAWMPFELTEPVSDGCLLGMVIHQYLASRNVEVLMSLPTKMPGSQEADYFPAGKIKKE